MHAADEVVAKVCDLVLLCPNGDVVFAFAIGDEFTQVIIPEFIFPAVVEVGTHPAVVVGAHAVELDVAECADEDAVPAVVVEFGIRIFVTYPAL